MSRLTLQQKWEMLEIYFHNKDNWSEIARKCKTKFGKKTALTANGVKKFVHKVRDSGMLIDKPTRPRANPVRTPQNIAAVAENVRQRPRTSIRRRALELNISYTSTQRILRKDLGLWPYKVQLVQELKARDHPLRYQFAVWACEQLETDPDFAQKIIFSDEAHFHVGGYVNKQNCRIWGSENPREFVQKPMHPLRATVWCGLWRGGIIGPYFFENEDGQTVTVNGERYRHMLTSFVWPQIDEDELDELWFQQDGATCHTSGETIAVVRQQFDGRIISRNADVNWPPRSCDLTPLDFYLWGAVKDKCYVDNPETIEHLKANIEAAIAAIEPETIQNVLRNWTDRMAYCKASRGSHLNEVIFHH
jgi:hypothetical protein